MGVNGKIMVPGEKLIFTAWTKHFNTFLLEEVTPLEPQFTETVQPFAPANEETVFILSKQGGDFSCCCCYLMMGP